ncbi:tyrosine-type recombinase/integrase [Deinococcus hopiensis]|uniref:tyrosine-type recombinase/integrase n=1 Tax=Deinococcus hopiensis TaxID=309885 RepID=UPI003CCB8A75
MKVHHALRRTAGTRLMREGASLNNVSGRLGHLALKTAHIYAKWSDDGPRCKLAGW